MEHTEWGILIVNYLFLGGISAGCFFASALAAFLPDGAGAPYQRIARCGAWIARSIAEPPLIDTPASALRPVVCRCASTATGSSRVR